MAKPTQTDRYCVIGAGASGLAVAKTFMERGIPFDCFERESDIGGLWNEATPTGLVYETAHLVSSRTQTEFDDFPMPEDDPIYPNHRQVLAYFKDYANHFGIRDAITFDTTVEHVEESDGGWRVKLAGERTPRHYAGVVVANGHHDVPRMPQYKGSFKGEILHSRDYRKPSQLAGKRVLVVGAGNSACDIAIDAVHHAREANLSIRHGYYFVRKFMCGWPTDKVLSFFEAMRLPRLLRQYMYMFAHRIITGPARRYGLPTPEHRILDTHPTLNSELPGHVAHGNITVRADIEAFDGKTVRFSDETASTFDLIIYATGYAMSFPFMDDDLLIDGDGRPKLYLNVFHPKKDTLFAAGLVQANGSIWRLADYQARLIANFIVARALDNERASWFGALKSGGRNAESIDTFMASERHLLERDYYAYGRHLRKLNRRFGAMAEARYPTSARQAQRAAPTGESAVDAASRQHAI